MEDNRNPLGDLTENFIELMGPDTDNFPSHAGNFVHAEQQPIDGLAMLDRNFRCIEEGIVGRVNREDDSFPEC